MIKIESTPLSCGFSLEVILLGILPFLFIILLLSADHHHLCIEPLFCNHFKKATLTSDVSNWGSFGLFLHWSQNSVGKLFVAAKNEVPITSYIGLQNFFCFWKKIQRLHSLFLGIPNSSTLLIFK